jgi:MFS family permease
MVRTLELLRRERKARIFFLTLTQSALGTGAAYVALLLVAYERFRSPWAISLVLIADLVAPMFLGPIFGAVADRWSRKWCTVAADVIRAVAFAGLAAVSGFGATIALAFAAGAGTGLFTPASLAALPSLVKRERLPAATSLYGAIQDLGFAVGPAVAAAVLVLGDAEAILLLNSASFAISALVLAALSFGGVHTSSEEEAASGARSLLGEAREGLRLMRGIPGLWTVLGASGLAMFFAGLMNVAELPLILDDIGATEAAYSAAVAVAGTGVVFGSLAGSAGGALLKLRQRYLMGLLIMSAGTLLFGVAPTISVVFLTFIFSGFGNGMMLVYERLIVQTAVPDRITARVFGVKDALTAWAFALSFLAAGGLVSTAGPRPVVVAAGVGLLAVTVVAALGMRRLQVDGLRGARSDLLRNGGLGQHGSHLVSGGDHWLTLIDDLGNGGDDDGVELGSSIPR